MVCERQTHRLGTLWVGGGRAVLLESSPNSSEQPVWLLRGPVVEVCGVSRLQEILHEFRCMNSDTKGTAAEGRGRG